ncbi:MAG: hypothetical protein AB8B85_21740 [Paracoccaceae bacterium]
MSDETAGWWVMAVSIAALCLLLLAIVWVPGFGPSEDALACDSRGGYWSSDDEACHISDSPAAGLAA